MRNPQTIKIVIIKECPKLPRIYSNVLFYKNEVYTHSSDDFGERGIFIDDGQVGALVANHLTPYDTPAGDRSIGVRSHPH